MTSSEFDHMQHDFDEADEVVVHLIAEKTDETDIDRAVCSLLPYDPQRWKDSTRGRVMCPACRRVSRLLVRLSFVSV